MHSNSKSFFRQNGTAVLKGSNTRRNCKGRFILMLTPKMVLTSFVQGGISSADGRQPWPPPPPLLVANILRYGGQGGAPKIDPIQI